MKKTLAERLAPKYESRMSKHPLGQYRERVWHQHRDGLQEGGAEGLTHGRSTPHWSR
jgi:hypothetical protein